MPRNPQRKPKPSAAEDSGSKVSETTPSGLEWKPDGTRLYVVGQYTNSVLEFHTTGSNFDIGSLPSSFILKFLLVKKT